MLSGLERARGGPQFGAQPIGLTGSVGLGPGSGLTRLFGHSGRGDRLLASLLLTGQCLAEPIKLFRVCGSGAAGLVALALGLAKEI
ncbi:hypothetical protein E1292_22165 [Nonomuraea deserti]|uniref:Uncharacterized protein n=1 Tax=Nonomuraea deserti TaxID=1848322 RepID=A0A4R4VCH7_9ACTN|nr:hypothetical protein [Nonomuraea deserti]TDD02942.1 hypothetical protein E1292_22165 [Nonomuraea deserti]